MSINVSGVNFDYLSPLSSKSAAGSANVSSSSAGTSSSATSQISTTSAQLQQLQDLATSNPDKFRATVTAIADQLSTAASQNTTTPPGQLFSDLAAKFRQAEATGDFSKLSPPLPPFPDKSTSGKAIAAYQTAQQGTQDVQTTVQSVVANVLAA